MMTADEIQVALEALTKRAARGTIEWVTAPDETVASTNLNNLTVVLSPGGADSGPTLRFVDPPSQRILGEAPCTAAGTSERILEEVQIEALLRIASASATTADAVQVMEAVNRD